MKLSKVIVLHGHIMALVCLVTGLAVLNGAALKERYLPYVPEDLARRILQPSVEEQKVYWRTPAEIRALRSETSKPLEGLRLVVDPGHLGGRFAAMEARNFRMAPSDKWIREGDLVLAVAERIQLKAERLGAEVTLTRTDDQPVNDRPWFEYFRDASIRVQRPTTFYPAHWLTYTERLFETAIRLKIVRGEIEARAHLINEMLRPDLTLSLHINAAPWGKPRRLVGANHLHLLIFGTVSEAELLEKRQTQELLRKLHNGSGPVEEEVAIAMAQVMADRLNLPPASYGTANAVLVDKENPYVFARNLLLLRKVESPCILLEPFVANSEVVYNQFQKILSSQDNFGNLDEDHNILTSYAESVIFGLIHVYGQARGK